MLKKIKVKLKKVKNVKFYEEKKRFLLFSLLLLTSLMTVLCLVGSTYSSYESKARLTSDIDRAIYLIDVSEMEFNIDPEKIVPSDEPYIYRFSVSNFNETQENELDIEYSLTITTTTNLPLTFELYKDQNYGDNGITNIFSNSNLKQDIDGAWYRVYETNQKYTMPYGSRVTHVYTLVVNFPSSYANSDVYAGCVENIEVAIKSNQIV